MNDREAYEYHLTRPLGEQFRLAWNEACHPPLRGILAAFVGGFALAAMFLAR